MRPLPPAIATQVDASGGPPVLVAGSVVFSLGLAPVDTPTTDLAVGATSAITETSAELGGAPTPTTSLLAAAPPRSSVHAELGPGYGIGPGQVRLLRPKHSISTVLRP
jgi:hypothetical protein